MAMADKKGIYWVTGLFLAFVLIVGVLQGCNNEEPEEPEEVAKAPNDATPAPVARETPNDPIEAATRMFRDPKAELQNVIKAADTWYPAYEQWQGRPAPDITLTDIEGNTHKLSDYRGKEVMLVFFATWCGPCKLEIPHLKELRETMPEKELAILAVSNEAPALVTSFAQENDLNYTVLLNPGGLPAPYSEVESIPSSLFVDPQGVIKLGTLGIVPASDAEAIVQAG
jgi:peroxiredoxin